MSTNLPGLHPPIEGAPPPEQGAASRRRLGRQRLYLRRFMRNRAAVVGLVIMGALVLFSLIGSLFTHYSYSDVDFANLSSPPSTDHPFGTNGAGNDTYAQAVHGVGRSLIIAVTVSLITTALAAVVGTGAAYFQGRIEKATLQVIHFLLVVPGFLILALMSQRSGGDWRVLIIALIILGWMFNARVVWALATSLREREYVQAARFMGVSPITVVLRHLIPNIGSLLIISFTLGVVSTVQSETALSFIGFGVMPPDVSLGTMLGDGSNTITSAPWLFYFPAALVTLLTISMALFADGLRDALDPNSQSGGRA